MSGDCDDSKTNQTQYTGVSLSGRPDNETPVYINTTID